MEQYAVRYPTVEYRRAQPGSKGLNKHYKAHRIQFFGHKGILKTTFQTIHRNPSVGLYTDQRGIPSFAYKIPDGKIYKTAPQMDKIPRGGNVPRVVGTLGDVFQDVVDQGTPGAASVLRNGGGPNTPTSTVAPPSTSTAEIQGSQALGSNLSLVGSSTDVYQAPSEFDDDIKEQREIAEKLTHAMIRIKEEEVFGSPSVIITNPADEKTSRLPGVHQETIDYADGDAQPGYVENKRTFAKSKEEKERESKMAQKRKMSNAQNAVMAKQLKMVQKRKMSNAMSIDTSPKFDAMSIDTSPKSDAMSIDKNNFNPLQNFPSTETEGAQTNKTITQEMYDLDKRMDQNNFNPLQNADRIVPSTETFITFPGPPRLQYIFNYGPVSRRKTPNGKYQRIEIPVAKKRPRKNR